MCSSSATTSSTSSSAEQQQNTIGHHCDEGPSTSSGSSSPSTELASYPLIPREQLQVQQHLGAGTYGSVFKGIWERSDGTALQVALKKVFMLEKEVEILSQIRHRNIIQFFGVSQANPDFYIVTEYAENSSLYEHLHNKSEQISLEWIIKWAMQIARGVAYLHNEAPITVIHRDLKSKNIVIGKKFQCKLCDFGTSKDLTHSWTAPSWGGTAAWMSPEIISQREGISTATDVWSFAVVLWEMFSREVPYKGLTEFKIYSIISQHGVRLVIPEQCPEPLAMLLASCWNLNPKERPDMRTVLAVLERMAEDELLRAECAHFLCEGQAEWRLRIRQQLDELDTLKLDLARQMEDLSRREQALRKRESSHRNFLHMVDILNVENVCEWNEDCVCEWVQNIAAAAVADFPDETVDKIISSTLQYGINGPRLLKITEKDLESLGIEPVALRRYIMHKLDELRELCNVQLCNFPCSPDSPAANIDPSNGGISSRSSGAESQQQQPPIECPIVLHVGLYSRNVTANNKSYRFKVFLDSDWEDTSAEEDSKTAGDGEEESNKLLSPQAQPALQDSATIIKEVNISMSAADGSTLLRPVQCICPPFGYLEWAQISREEQQKKLPLTISVQVAYTDQVIQPRNTRIQIKPLAGGPRTLCCKRVPLKLCPTPTDTSLSRISSSLLKSPPATFRTTRRRSFGLSGSISPDRRPPGISGSSSNLLNRSPVWADLAASIRNSTFPTFRPVSRSITSAGGLKNRSNSTTEEGETTVGDSKRGSVDLQSARHRALAKVRAQRAQRKKCVSETESDRQQEQNALDKTGHLDTQCGDTRTGTVAASDRPMFTMDSPNTSMSSSGGASHSSSAEKSPQRKTPDENQPNEPAEEAQQGRRRSRDEKKLRPPTGLSKLVVPAPENLLKISQHTGGGPKNKIEKAGRT